MLELMKLTRISEQEVARHYFDNKIFSFVHFCVGQEAIPAALGTLLTKGDHFFGNHRSHGHFLSKGGDPRSMFAEMLGKKTGCASGKGGSMHMIDRKVGFMGSSPILSSNLPIALGDSMAQSERSAGKITVCFTGDGASEEGNFYETLNAASLWGLPLMVVVENNHYSVNSPQSKRRPMSFSLQKLADSLGVRYFHDPGDDPRASLNMANQAIKWIRKHQAPVLFQADVFRHMAHSAPVFDDGAYRKEDIINLRQTSDPILLLEATLRSSGVSESSLTAQSETIRAAVLKALALAIQDSDPDPIELLSGVYV